MRDFVPSAAARAAGEEVARLRKQLADLFAAGRTDDGYDLSAEKVAEIRAMNDAVAAKATAYEALIDIESIAHGNKQALRSLTDLRPPMPHDALGGPTEGKARSLVEILSGRAAEIKALAAGGRGALSFELSGPEAKNVTSAMFALPADRQPIVPAAAFLADVTDLFLPGTTESTSVDFPSESTFTNAAAETAEAAAAPESALAYTPTSFPVREISTWVPVTRQALSDIAGLASHIEGRLGHMVATRRSAQLINGAGTGVLIRGVLQTSGIQTRARGTDPIPDAYRRAMTLVRVTGDAEPTGLVVHPNDWDDVRLMRTIDGVYIWGAPNEPGPERMWGLGVRMSTSIPENTSLVGAFRPFAQVFRREGLTIEISTEHASMFTERRAAILAYERLALAVYRPAAFCSVTGV